MAMSVYGDQAVMSLRQNFAYEISIYSKKIVVDAISFMYVTEAWAQHIRK